MYIVYMYIHVHAHNSIVGMEMHVGIHIAKLATGTTYCTCTSTCTYYIYMYIEDMRLTSQLKCMYVRLFLDNAAILSGKNIARFYTISETQAARN